MPRPDTYLLRNQYGENANICLPIRINSSMPPEACVLALCIQPYSRVHALRLSYAAPLCASPVCSRATKTISHKMKRLSRICYNLDRY